MKEAYSSCGLTRAQYVPILYVLQLLSFALFFIVPCRVAMVLLQKTGSKQITKKETTNIPQTTDQFLSPALYQNQLFERPSLPT